MTREEALAAVGRQQRGSALASVEGCNAARGGLPWTRNPYAHGTAQHRAWLHGYRVSLAAPVGSYRLPGDRRAA